MPAECPICGGRCRVESSKRSGDRQVRYVVCQACRRKARIAVPASQVWRRSK